MTTKTLLTAIIFISSFNIVSAKAKIPVCFPCETINTVQELPTGSEIDELAGQHVNIAYLNNEYGILWMSFWNTNGRYVLSNASNTTYFEIDDQASQILKDKHNFDIETAENPLSFFKKIGGKLILFIVIALLIWGNLPSKNKDVKPTNI
ncbi:hypothetical protein J2X31_003589 [Flavobacterium arsenatis]|uniref:Uncharacterized protein n=1 Tax=Flavobacterium arsenatis TaxID=1484332 RepID=A0ABU1TUK8_9FLAO|nr:hypothetical protein [Flavobacterium arsenatis]MDR6969556.1 hypothetical protein [Flavobacterium arsenatis]